MIDVYQKQVFETRETICQVTHHDRLLLECSKVLKNEISELRKTSSALRRAGILPETYNKSQLWHLICSTFSPDSTKRSVTRQKLLIMQLNCLASEEIVYNLSRRLENMSYSGEINLKRIRRDEQKFQRQLEKASELMEGSTQVRFINFTKKIGDYKGQLKAAREARIHGEAAHRHLRNLSNDLREITFWGSGEAALPGENDDHANALLERMFESVINACIHLCGFKSEVNEFAQSRDLDLHFQAVMHFRTDFFNCLTADWVESRKLRMTGFCVQKTVDSLGMLMKGLSSRILKIEEELEIIHEESSAILMVAEKV
ncbi:hypothetical protein [Geofilum rubicundum]|uniref:Uncharacterized protein n=1 Tax=Geofilum rubicundum JCM 15548 TaxID=1236989 RepID=A0A0E9LXY7_9BACT|nr:hypothetical protein [Geofilum rubicundum]GAO29740.1 hypothetical protein JCM15548_11960 [Geofilum rubicundum JCM 15548]